MSSKRIRRDFQLILDGVEAENEVEIGCLTYDFTSQTNLTRIMTVAYNKLFNHQNTQCLKFFLFFE